MRKIVQKNEVSIMKLSTRRGLECRILHHLSQTPGRKGRHVFFFAIRINLPATFQFSPATSKSIDIPGDWNFTLKTQIILKEQCLYCCSTFHSHSLQ
jgi:hypothetical protein